MFKEFFKKYEPDGIEKLSRARRNNIRSAVFSRINETEDNNELVYARRFKLKPAFIAAAAAVLTVTGVTVGALSSPPDNIKVNGVQVEPYYNIYQDTDGAMVEITGIEVPKRLLTEAVPDKTATGEIRLVRFDNENPDTALPRLIDETQTEYNCSINNMLILAKVTHSDGSVSNYSFDVSNKTEDYYYKMIDWEDKGISVFFPFTVNIDGMKIAPEYDITVDRDGAWVETFIVNLPDSVTKEEAENLTPTGNLSLKRLDEEGNKISPCLVDENGTEFYESINNMFVEVKITHSDGTAEFLKFNAANALNNFDYSNVEMEFSLII